MRKLTAREKRTVKIGVSALLGYLALFYGFKGFQAAEAWRGRYEQAELACSAVERDILRERAKAQRLEKLRSVFRFEPDRQRPETVVGDVRVQLQKLSQQAGFALGSSKESPGRPDGKELAVLELEGLGPTLSAIRFLDAARTIGYPLVVDRMEWKTGGLPPGQVRLTLGVVVLRYEPKAASSGAPHSPTDSPAAPPAAENAPPSPPLPDKLQAVDTSGIFGVPPKTEGPPVLLGIAGRHALLAAPNGKKGLVAEGEAFEGVKLLRIGTNRALVEYKGQTQELLLFSGLGGTTLVPPAKKNEGKDPAP